MNASRVLATLLALAAPASAVLVPDRASAQSPTTGELSGVVQTALGAPLAEVQLTLRPVAGGLALEAESDSDGRFLLPLLPAGEYELLAERLGYLPVVLTPVPVRPDRRLSVAVTLTRTEGEVVSEPERVQFGGGTFSGGSRPGQSRYFGGWELESLPERGGEMTELVRFSSLGEDPLEVEGLPSSLGRLVVGGVPFEPATLGAGGRGLVGLIAPIRAARGVELLAGRTDVEWSSAAGGLLAMEIWPGERGVGGDLEGLWSGSALFLEDYPNAEPSTVRAGGRLGGSLVGDSAHAAIFAEFQQRSVPVWLWPESDGGLADGLGGAGVDVSGLTGNAVSETQRINAGGSFDWRLGEGQMVSLFALYGQGEQNHAPASLTGRALPVLLQGDDLLAAAAATGAFGESVAGQARIGFARSTRESDAGHDLQTGLGDAAVAFAPAGGQIGDPFYPATSERSELYADGTLYYRSGPHHFKLGVGARFTQHERSGIGGAGLYLFGDAQAFQARTGAFLGLNGAGDASFSVQEYAIYGQDTWTVVPGLQVTTGLRYEIETLPSDDVIPNRRWLQLTGIDNTQIPGNTGDVGLVAGFDWNVQQQHVWRVRGGLGIHRGDVPADVLTEVLTFDGRVEASAAVGDVTATTELGPRLTLLSPDFVPPTTTRASVGLSRALGSSAAFHLGAAFRRTDNLPVRRDLNRPTQAAFEDQYGRPVYGPLVREGPLLLADPGHNRRFAEFDVVSAVSADAYSQYWGVTAGLEKRFGALQTSIFYTRSATEDDWLTPLGDPLGGIDPFDGSDAFDGWADGTSDFDVPNRLTAAAEMALPFASGFRVGGSMQWASGRPFTPGFGPGIDANGDGVAGNDPAFIDASVPGVDEAIAEWSCLREGGGSVVERNACRTDDRTLFDAWVGIRLPVAGVVPELRVEALALQAEDLGLVDTALYQLDPNGEVVTNGSRFSVPLIANPGFGQPLQPAAELTRIRISLRMVF